MGIYARLMGIAGVVSGLGLPEALLAGDVWKGSWKFEFDRFDRPFLTYSDTGGKTVFRFGCGTHFEMDAVYPGERRNRTTPRPRSRSPTARRRWISPASPPPVPSPSRRTPRCSTRQT